LKSPKTGKLNIDTLILPQGLLIHEKKTDQKISCYCPFNNTWSMKRILFLSLRREEWRLNSLA